MLPGRTEKVSLPGVCAGEGRALMWASKFPVGVSHSLGVRDLAGCQVCWGLVGLQYHSPLGVTTKLTRNS